MRQLPSKQCEQLRKVTPRRALDELMLPPATLETLLRLKLEFDRRHLLARNNIPPRNRLLFYGPPGNGKTAAAEAVAYLLDRDFYIADYSQLHNSLLGSSEKAVVAAFEAIHNQECVVLFDEVDSILSSRITPDSSADMAHNNSTNLLLTRLDQLPPQVLFIAATNRIDDLDQAAARRFDLIVGFEPPSYEDKVQFCQVIIKRYPVLKSKAKPAQVAKESNVDSFAELEKEIIDLARQEILRS